MAAIIAAVAATSAALSTLHLTRRSSFSRHRRAFRSLSPPLRSSLSSSSPPSASEEFNITFAPKPKTQKPGEKPSSSIDDELPSGQLLIPWIVRGPDGNLTLQSHPPAHLLHAMADAKTQKKKAGIAKLVEEPKYSKAARRFYNDRFREPPQRLSKVLAAAGVASRRNCEDLIFEGQVTVNGSVCKTPQTKVDPARDVIYVKGNRLPKKLPPKVYLALNKPKGYICSSGGDEFNSLMVLFDDYLKSWDKRNSGQPRPRLFTVGRLDVATTGLIIVTNDGEFAQKISHPSSNLTKEYIATIDSEVHKRHLIAISEGTTIDGVHCTPDLVELLPRQPDLPRPRVRIVVHEGRNHEVRELVKDAGLEIYSLKRTRIGGYRLPSDLGLSAAVFTPTERSQAEMINNLCIVTVEGYAPHAMLGKHVELKQSDLKALGWTS